MRFLVVSLFTVLAFGQTPSLQQANDVQPVVTVLPLSASTVTDIHLRPLFTTTIRLPETVTSVAVGAPTLFEVEHSDQEPQLVFVKPSTREAATSNLIIALQSGHEISMRLISDGAEGKTQVDFVINYQPAQSFLIGSSDPMTTGEEDSPARKGVPQPIQVIDQALKRQANIATPEWQEAPTKNNRNPDAKAPGRPLLGALGEVFSQGDEMWVAYSVLNTTDHWVEVLPPQVEINSPNLETAEKKDNKDKKKGKQILAEEVAVRGYRLNATRLAPGGRADGAVEFSRPGFKQGKDMLMLELATASEVDNPLFLPVPFVAPAK